jgi:hypothetical protein
MKGEDMSYSCPIKSQGKKRTLHVAEMMILQKGRMSKGSGADEVTGQLVHHVRSPETISPAGVKKQSSVIVIT